MKPTTAHVPTTRETGWLPDCVYTGEKFESGLAFFADGLGRITRFSREPADCAAARRLEGQAALPGLINTHSRALDRLARSLGEVPARRALRGLTADDIYEATRMAFMEMLLAGITCVGEFHSLHHAPAGAPAADPNACSHAVLRAARETGIRITLFKVASAQPDRGADADAGCTRGITPTAGQFIRELEALRDHVARELPGDDVGLGVGVRGVGAVPLAYLKELAAHAHTRRYRLQVPLTGTADESAAWQAETGRTPVQWLADHGLIDKRFIAIHASDLSVDEVGLLGAARAAVCACPTTERQRGQGQAPISALLAAGVGVALGSGRHVQINLLEEARWLQRGGDVVRGLASSSFHAATVAGARSLGVSCGALEVGRPADFFTVNLFDPSVAGATPDVLLQNVVFSLERRAIREVWVGARPRVTGGRHLQQGPIVGRFVDLQRRLAGT